jgi:predicted RNA-binding Zn ribbon-like protein
MTQGQPEASADVAASWPGAWERPLDLLRRFLNTVRLEEAVDLLNNPAEASAWFAAQGFGDLTLSPSALRRHRAVRDLARRAMRGEPAAVSALNDLLPDLTRASSSIDRSPSGWSAGLRPSSTPPDRCLLQSIALNLWRGAANGELNRLKICADERCQLAFYDRSRNQSRVWCTAGECGNRNRVARHRAKATATIDG